MGANIRITVIATGFEKQHHQAMPTQEVKREVILEKPRHIEVKLEEEVITSSFNTKPRDLDSMEFRKRIKELGLDSMEDDEYDIPTFLRKQVD
jgi:hypothetical protein